MLMQVKKAVLAVIKPLLALPAIDPLIYCYLVEQGACNLFLTTSARYPASMGQDGVARVPADSIATGVDEKVVSGVYIINVAAEVKGVRATRLQAWKKRRRCRGVGGT